MIPVLAYQGMRSVKHLSPDICDIHKQLDGSKMIADQ